MTNRPPEVLDRTLSPALVNIVGTFIILALFALILGVYSSVWHENPMANYYSEDVTRVIILGLAVFFISIVVHEGLHGIGYRMGGARWADIQFGFQWKALMPYARCQVPLRANAYRLAVALPGVILGLIPTLAGIVLHLDWLTIYGAVMAGSAVGDMMILALLLPLKGDMLILDHPTKPGFQIIQDR